MFINWFLPEEHFVNYLIVFIWEKLRILTSSFVTIQLVVDICSYLTIPIIPPNIIVTLPS